MKRITHKFDFCVSFFFDNEFFVRCSCEIFLFLNNNREQCLFALKKILIQYHNKSLISFRWLNKFLLICLYKSYIWVFLFDEKSFLILKKCFNVDVDCKNVFLMNDVFDVIFENMLLIDLCYKILFSKLSKYIIKSLSKFNDFIVLFSISN